MPVLSLSIWIAFCWGVLYGLVEAIPLVYENVYGWRIGPIGLSFFSVVIGAFLGWYLNGFQETAYKKYRKHGTKAAGRAYCTFSQVTELYTPFRTGQRHRSASVVLDVRWHCVCVRLHDFRVGYQRPLDRTTHWSHNTHSRHLLNLSRRYAMS